ncbi:MAG: DUF6712 family protein [Bacteroidota bacterium]
MLFTDISNFKSFIGGAANVSLELESIKPTIEETAYNHIIPFIGEELWDDALTKFDAGSSDTNHIKLLPYIQKPLAMLSLYEYSKIGNIMMGEGGMFRMESDSMKTPYKYQENQYREVHLFQGYEALERLQKFLDKNADTYPLYTGSDAYATRKALLINYATEFRKYYSFSINRYTFEQILSVIEDVQYFAILPTLGQEQFAKLLEGNLNAKEKELLELCRKAIVHFTIQESLVRMWVRLEGNRIVQNESSGDQAYQTKLNASLEATGLLATKEQLKADRYIYSITEFLQNNLDQFELYKAHIEALATAEQERQEATQNERCESTINWFSGYGRGRCCSNYPTCDHTEGKAIKRL